MFNAVKSLYSSVSSCVKVNSFYTEWFCVSGGLRQGCILSPLLFNLYLDDLVKYIKAFNVGIDIGDGKICILLCADDIVLLASSETELQVLLNALSDWCTTNDMIPPKVILYIFGHNQYKEQTPCSYVATNDLRLLISIHI